MNSSEDDKEKVAEDDLRKAVDDLKKKDATEDRGDMPVDPSLGHPNIDAGKPEEVLPPDDDEN